MAGKRKKEIRWWPHYLLSLGGMLVIATVVVCIMAYLYPVPYKAPDEIPLPDHGENIMGPEWVFLIFWAPFWYLKGIKAKYLFIMPLIPILGFIFLFFLPFFHKLPIGKIPGLKSLMEKGRVMKSGLKKSFFYGLPALVVGFILFTAIYVNGHQAKLLGCDACHNPAMGHRMAIPPVDVFGYYNVERAMQIDVGKYRAGKSSGLDESGDMLYSQGEAQGYKDADWQMRHMYEPTFTW